MGVWIEMDYGASSATGDYVTPCVGVWIEINILKLKEESATVTPCVGVWIEIDGATERFTLKESLPAWECGLK